MGRKSTTTTKKKPSTRKSLTTSPRKRPSNTKSASKSKPKTVKTKVTKVIDGDTLKTDKKVAGSNYIRLANTDAPEKGQKGYKKAKENLENKVEGKTVKVEPKGKSYGRTVAKVTKDGKEVKASPQKTKVQKKASTKKKTSAKKPTKSKSSK